MNSQIVIAVFIILKSIVLLFAIASSIKLIISIIDAYVKFLMTKSLKSNFNYITISVWWTLFYLMNNFSFQIKMFFQYLFF